MKSPGLMGPKFCCCLQLLSVDELRTMTAVACNEVPVNLPSNKFTNLIKPKGLSIYDVTRLGEGGGLDVCDEAC